MVSPIGSQLKSVSQSETGEKKNASINLSANNTSEESVSCDYSIDCRPSACVFVPVAATPLFARLFVTFSVMCMEAEKNQRFATVDDDVLSPVFFLESICQLKINKRNETLDEKPSH